MATDGRATSLVIWWSDDPLDGAIGGDADVLFSRSGDDGASWSPPSLLNRNAAEDSGGDYAGALATDGHGKWIATWWSDDPLGGTVGGDYDVLAARSADGGITWTPPSPLNTNAAADSGDDRAPQVATDGRLWLAVWESSDTLGGRIGTDKDILSARSRDAGKTWSEPTPLAATFASDAASDAEPSLATDGAGNWLVTWHSTAVQKGMIGRSTRVLVSRSSDGGDSWSEPRPLDATGAAASVRALQPRVAAVERGRFAVVWSERSFGEGRARTPSVVRMSVSRDGGATWEPPALLTDGPADDEAPDVTADGASGWIVAWQSASSAGSSSIVVHRLPGSTR